MSELGQKKTDLTKVLRYAKELLSFNRKLISDIDAQTSLHLHEADLANLEGFNTNSDDDGWIRFARINETQPPTPDPMFESWVAAQRIQTPETPPKLIDKRVLRLSIEEISDLFEAGLIPDNGDVMEPLEDQTPRGMRDVILYTANLPEFREEWRTYLEGPWVKWAETERPRRKSIAAYNELFKAHQQIQSMGADTPVELVFGLGIARWKYETHKISLPLIEQLSEIILDDDGVLQVKPRDTDPYLNLKVFHQLDLPGAKRLEGEIARSFLEVARDPDRGFSPFDRSSFENTLRACASNLSGTAQYLPDQQGAEAKASTLPSPSEILQISDTWVVYLRPRQENFREEDIQRLIDEVEAVSFRDSRRRLPFTRLPHLVTPMHRGGWSSSIA